MLIILEQSSLLLSLQGILKRKNQLLLCTTFSLRVLLNGLKQLQRGRTLSWVRVAKLRRFARFRGRSRQLTSVSNADYTHLEKKKIELNAFKHNRP